MHIDGHDPEAIASALEAARTSDRPTLIAAQDHDRLRRADQGRHQQGARLAARRRGDRRRPQVLRLGYPAVRGALRHSRRVARRRQGIGRQARRVGKAACRRRPKAARRIRAAHAGDLPADFDAVIADYKKKLVADKPKVATRKSSEMALEVINGAVPETIGGSADLTGSNNTKTSQTKPIAAGSYGNRYVHYGIREHGMAAAMSGLSLHGGIIPYGGTFLCFSDYARPAMRLASLMGIRSIYVMTHDFDRPWRGRADPPAGRASRRAARDPQPPCLPPGRRHGSGRMLAACAGIGEDAVDTRADPPEFAGGAHRIRCREPVRPRRLRARQGERRRRGDDLCHRLRGGDRARRPRAARRPWPPDPRRLGPLLRTVREAERDISGVDPRQGAASRLPSRPASARAGTASSASTASSSA